MHDLIIIGGGPGGVAAGVYGARKKIRVLLIAESFGGQSIVSAEVQNWIGTKAISGFDLAKQFEEHVKVQEGIEILEGDRVNAVEQRVDGGFHIKTEGGKEFDSRYLLIASGSRRRKLGVPGEKELDGRGVAYCSICDAPLFKDKAVAVVGGGNAGLEAVNDLFPYASHVTLLERGEVPKGDPVTLEKIKKNPKFELLTSVETTEIFGDSFVSGLKYKDAKTNEIKKLDVQGVFVEIGAVPNSEFVKDLVKLNPIGEIIVDHKTQAASCDGIYAVGDVSDVLYKQNNISAGDGVKALLSIYDRIMKS